MAEDLKIPASTLEQQFKASDPASSSWLSANAGSGKTHVLTQRVIRLMLDGNAPDRILCLTFTKAAAANMKNRVFETLAKWTMMDDAKLGDAIRKTTGKKADPFVRITARQLFARALDTPGGLKIQTIHGFCESLLHQFPLEANVPGHFETVQEVEQADMLKRAMSDILSGHEVGGENIVRHYEALVPNASDAAITAGISAIVSEREDFLRWIESTGIDDAMAELCQQFGIAPDDTAETIRMQIIDSLPVTNDELHEIAEIAAQEGGVSNTNMSERLSRFLTLTDGNERFEAICDAVLTGSEKEPDKRKIRSESAIVTKAVRARIPELIDKLLAVGDFLLQARDKINAPQLLKNSRHLFELGHAVLLRYQTLKRRRGMIDFADQIERAANLLERSEIRDWIRYRLDRGVDHVLVDEAQDTSPAQWQIINAITDDFHSGENASAKTRTVFVVGDEKQSIFSFQGAEPQEFDTQRNQLQRRVKNSEKPYHPGNLTLSFRSTEDVLKAVDTVFAIEKNRKGLTREDLAPIHNSVRETHPGEVQIWPLLAKFKSSEPESWLDPVDHAGNDDPAIALAKRISGEIRQLVGKPLPGMDRPLAFKDILVLVRNRDRFITALTRTMKDDGLAVAGADRLKLTEHIAVEDMIAVGRAALLPQDDLSLACTLKSLFFNLSEEELFALSSGRGKDTGLFEQISQIGADARHPDQELASGVLEEFNRIRHLAETTPAYEFYARLLGEFGGRRKILARLGSEAEDVMDAFLDEALTHSREQDGGLEGFLSEITRADPEIKREVELDRDEVRILTVHASKGLEAPVIFLVDSCGPAWRESHRPALLKLPSDHDYKPYVWLPSSKQHTSQTRQVSRRLEQAAEAEYRRLLYVGMTRAADRLIVCGYHGIYEPKHDHWHKMVQGALADSAGELRNSQGETIGLRWVDKEKPPVKQKAQSDQPSESALSELPEWLFKRARTEPPLPRPLTPSGASVLIDDRLKPQPETPVAGTPGDSRFALQKGNVTHKLLEVLPELAVEKRRMAAETYVSKACTDWTAKQKQEVVESVFAILDGGEFSGLFTDTAKAEVSIAGWVETKPGRLQISGQIDRLIVRQSEVVILDYKTNFQVPDTAENVPLEYRIQLALYRDLASQVYPQHKIVSALLWTQAPKMMVLDDDVLDRALQAFKNR